MPDPISEDVQQFHRWSRTYERSLGQFFFFRPVHWAVMNLVEASLDGSLPESVLDIGCGTGRLLRRIGLRWPSALLIGVDPAEGMVQQARRLTPSTTFHSGSAEALPLPDSFVDVAFSTISFHHWSDQVAGVREVVRVMRRGGLFCLADHGLPRVAGKFIAHTRIHTPAEMTALFERAGLPVRSQTVFAGGLVTVTLGRKD